MGINMYMAPGSVAINNIIYSAVPLTGKIGIFSGGDPYWCPNIMISNNIIANLSGVNCIAIKSTGMPLGYLGYNAFYNNLVNINTTHEPINNETAHDVALTADPFTNAAAGDFSLTAAAKAALRSAGWPESYLGAATDPHITIGAVQYGEDTGGSILRARILGG